MTHMSSNAFDPDDTELAPDFTVRDYLRARDSRPPDRAALAAAVHERFASRYIEPAKSGKHGFTKMAVSCLMIEALMSFVRGWPSTQKPNELAFCSFFDRFDEFDVVRGHATVFYKHIRCGLLHQAETTGGWRIRRDGSPLIDPDARTVNADRFIEALECALRNYCRQLREQAWDSPTWQNARKKIDSIVKNCRAIG
jgi:hypothetical protein